MTKEAQRRGHGWQAPAMVWLVCAAGAITLAPEAAAGHRPDPGDARPTPAGSWTCVPEGRECTFGSDCCSKKCVNDPKLGKVCKPKDGSWTCVPEGRECTFSSDCCSKKCINDPKLGKVCKPKDGTWTCVPKGRKCTFSSDCCSKSCVSDPKLGKVCKAKT
ncbi:MAG: hypothetical protein JRI68_26155 [Deltaproteobacteria bacterium]|nr:hypothetical protein [Deltaproteobacteria bacterium]